MPNHLRQTMSKDEILAFILPMVENYQFKEVLELLFLYVKDHDKALENEILYQAAGFKRNNREKSDGLISEEEYKKGQEVLRLTMNLFIDTLPLSGNGKPQELIQRKREAVHTEKHISIKKILFMTANPDKVLRTEQEMREVKDELLSSSERDKYEVIFEPAVRKRTITHAMRKHKPQIVHFSGHGAMNQKGEIIGIAVEDESGSKVLFPTEGLSRLFNVSKGHVQCVLLNSCYSDSLAQMISEFEIYVIGMADAIEDDNAREFSVGFYQSIAEGDSFVIAYDMGMVCISGSPDADLPQLWYNGEKVLRWKRR